MDLLEHQAKELFTAYRVPVPVGTVASSAREAGTIAASLLAAGNSQVVVKAQVRTGGRGKVGGVKLARGADEAAELAARILGMDIKGHRVEKVLVEAASPIAREYYLSFLVDRARRGFLAIASAEGGMEIEDVPLDRLGIVPISPLTGVDPARAAEIAAAGGLPAGAAEVISRLWSVFTGEQATLVEVNPLVLTHGGDLVALDGKITLDGNAAFRRRSAVVQEDSAEAGSLEGRARAKGLNYVKLDGSVGVIGNGAGLVMSTLDVVEYAGSRPANFLDIGGGASAEVMANGLEIVLSDPGVKSVLVNVFGGITACDAVAGGIVSAYRLLGSAVDRPLVVRLDGNNAELGRRILDDAALEGVTQIHSMDEAARRAAELATAGA